MGLIPGSGRSPVGGHGNPLQYSGLENHMDGGVGGSMGSQRVQHNSSDLMNINNSYYFFCRKCIKIHDTTKNHILNFYEVEYYILHMIVSEMVSVNFECI